MANAQLRYQGPANAKCTPAPDFKVGDQVYVKAKYFRSTRPSKKLSEKNLGPYAIIAQVGSLSFTLHLPDSMCAVHPVFHWWKLMVNWSSRSPRSLIPRLTAATKCANSCTWYVGPVTKELTKKRHGYLPQNLATQQSSWKITMSVTRTNPDHSHPCSITLISVSLFSVSLSISPLCFFVSCNITH